MPIDDNSTAEAELLLNWAIKGHGGNANNALLARLVVAIDNLESAIKDYPPPQ